MVFFYLISDFLCILFYFFFWLAIVNVFLGFSEKLFGIMKFTQLEIIFSFTAIKGRKFALVKRITITSGSL